MSAEPKKLPPRPSLQHLKYQAIDLIKAAKAGDPDALTRIGSGGKPTLADAQRTIAREYGFASWPKLNRYVESLVGSPPPPREVSVDMEPFKAAVRSGDAAAVRKMLASTPAVKQKIDAPVFEMDLPAVVYARHSREMVDALLEAGADINARGQFWGRAFCVLDDVPADLADYYVSRGAIADLGPFAEAVGSGNVAAARRLLEQNPSLRHHIDRPLFPFGQRPVAAARKNLPMVDLLLEYGADINLKSDWWAGGFTILDNADPGTANEMIARGATVDVHAAAHLGMFDRVKELIARDPSLVNARGGDGKCPLHVASTKEIVEFLLDRGAEIDARCVDHLSTPAQYSVRQPWKCRLLLERGATPDIFMAAALGDAELAAALVEEDPECVGARVGEPGYPPVPVGAAGSIYQWELPAKSPHEVAAKLGHWAVYELLMGETPALDKFAFACVHGDSREARSMLDARPQLIGELVAKYPRLLAEAAWANQLQGVRTLLDAGFPVNETGDGEGTALDRAAIRGYVEIVKLLLARGADVTLRNVYGGDPLGACQWGSLNFRDRLGDYPASAETLIAAGAAVPQRAGGSDEVAAVLRKHGAKG